MPACLFKFLHFFQMRVVLVLAARYVTHHRNERQQEENSKEYTPALNQHFSLLVRTQRLALVQVDHQTEG